MTLMIYGNSEQPKVHPNKVSRLESFFSIFQAPGGVKEMPLKPAKVGSQLGERNLLVHRF